MKQKSILGLCLLSALTVCACQEKSDEKDPSQPSCQNGTYSCDGNALKLCDNNEWRTERNCSDNQQCSESAKTCIDKIPETADKKCVEDAYFCKGDTALMHCEDGTWIQKKTCDSSHLCDSSKGDCVEKTVPSTPEDNKCKENEYSCNMNILSQCKSGKIEVVKACSNTEVCDAQQAACIDASAGHCIAGERRCSDDRSQVEKCTENGWDVDAACVNGLICDPESHSCVTVENNDKDCEGGFKCDVDGSRVLGCMNGHWDEIEKCNIAEGQTCDSEKMECRACKDGEITCGDVGNTILECKGGKWISSPCGDKEYCDPDAKKCEHIEDTHCTNGSTRCAGNLVETCVNGEWDDGVDCGGKICSDGACAAVCKDGETKCDGSYALLKCVNGEFKKESCGDKGQLCYTHGKTSACESIVCESDSCKSLTTRYVCDVENNTKNEMACASSEYCDSKTSQCTVRQCDDGETRCMGNSIETCKDNTWSVTKACGKQMCDEKSVKCIDVVCNDGDTRCNDKGEVETCYNNEFGSATACKASTLICVASSATDASCVQRTCTEGKTRCSGAMSQKCINNKWVDQVDCKDAKLCSATTGTCTTPVCTNGERKCSGSNKSIMVCKDYAWTTESFCSSVLAGSVCKETTSGVACKVSCTDGFSCDGNTLKVCKDGEFVDSAEKKCGDSATCDAASGACVNNECNNGQYICNGSTLRVCSNHKWVDKATCTKTQSCDAVSKACVNHDCETGDSKCSGADFYTCKDFKWVKDTTCNASQTCDAKQGCVNNECESGYKCDGNSLYTCSSKKWTKAQDCATGTTCNSSVGLCAECGGNSYECRGQDLYNCRNYKWVKQETCSATQKCSGSMYGGGCIETSECTNGAYQCNGNTLEICASGKWSTSKACDAKTEKCNATKHTCDVTSECTSGEVKCTGNSLVTCVSGKWSTTDCGTGTCDASQKKCVPKFVCNAGDYDCSSNTLMICKNNAWVVDTKCSSTQVCDKTAHKCQSTSGCTNGEYRCNDATNTIEKCNASGKWEEYKVCSAGLTCYSDGTQQTCIKVQEPPLWCNTQYVDGNTHRGYGRILYSDGTSRDTVVGYLACGKATDPVKNWNRSLGTINDKCSDCGMNTEYASGAVASLEPGENLCTYIFYDGSKDYYCLKDGGEPVEVTSTTMLDDTSAYKINVVDPRLSSVQKPSWCQFKALVLDDKGTNYGESYTLVYPGDLSGGQIEVRLYCGDRSTPFAHWGSSYTVAQENVFCNDCYANIEYMTDPRPGPISSKSVCAVTINYGTNYFVCPTEDGKEPLMVNPYGWSTLPEGYFRP